MQFEKFSFPWDIILSLLHQTEFWKFCCTFPVHSILRSVSMRKSETSIFRMKVKSTSTPNSFFRYIRIFIIFSLLSMLLLKLYKIFVIKILWMKFNALAHNGRIYIFKPSTAFANSFAKIQLYANLYKSNPFKLQRFWINSPPKYYSNGYWN